MCVDWKVPPIAFIDKNERDKFITNVWCNGKKNVKTDRGTKLRNMCNNMLLETELAWRFFVYAGITPIATQVCVAMGKLGTPLDVVAKDRDGKICIVEMKK